MNQLPKFTDITELKNSILKIPPQALDLEEVILGAIMVEKHALSQVVDILKPEMFYREVHQRIYAAIISLYEDSEPVDPPLLMNRLRQLGQLEMVGGPFYLTELMDKVVSSANIVYHARIIIQKFLSRSLIAFAQDIMREAYEETTDVLELMDSSKLALDRIASLLLKRPAQSGTEVLSATFQAVELAMNSPVGLSGVNTGLTDLNDLYGGFQKQDLIILAGRPGMGKSGLALGYARAALISGVPVGIFSMEMSSIQLMNRMLSMQCYHSKGAIIPYEDIKTGRLTNQQLKLLHETSQPYASDSLQIDDTPALSIQALRSRAIAMVTRHKVGLLIVDYLQLMEGDKRGNREQEIASISRALKNLAKELDIPIIALSQMSREVEKRADKRPQLSDLRESGEIEQASDIIQFVFRPHYYGITQDEFGNSTEFICEVLTRKNRNGQSPVDTLIKFIPSVSAICNWNSPIAHREKPFIDFTVSNHEEPPF